MILRGKTQKGKNRVRELGEHWLVCAQRDSVLFDSRPGPWLLVMPAGNPEKSRWIHATHDNDFEIL